MPPLLRSSRYCRTGNFEACCQSVITVCLQVNGHPAVGSQDSSLVVCQTCHWKVANSNPGRNDGRTLFSGVNFVRWLLFRVCSTPMLLQWHLKDLRHSAKSAGGRLDLNMLTPLTQRSWSELTMQLFRHSVGTYPETHSHATCQATFGHSHLTRWATVD